MTIIHRLCELRKLSTLKHSRLLANFTLKRSRLSAETLPLTIYAFIYLYKKTCSWQQQTVNNFFCHKSKSLILFICVFIISGCCKQNPSEEIQNSVLNLSSPPHRIFRQISGNTYKPSAYFICCEMRYSCLHAAKIEKPITFSKVSRSYKSNNLNFKGE